MTRTALDVLLTRVHRRHDGIVKARGRSSHRRDDDDSDDDDDDERRRVFVAAVMKYSCFKSPTDARTLSRLLPVIIGQVTLGHRPEI